MVVDKFIIAIFDDSQIDSNTFLSSNTIIYFEYANSTLIIRLKKNITKNK